MAEPDDVHVRAIRSLVSGLVRPVLIAIDGRAGSGKSTLARLLAGAVDACVVEGDDFYSGGELREWARRPAAEKAGRVIDWRRLRSQALEPLIDGRIARYEPFDWDGAGAPADRTVEPRPVVVLDGVYSGRPELADLVSIAVCVVLEDSTRRERLHARDAAWFDERWHAVWDEAEEHYFGTVRPPASFDAVVERT